MANLVSTQPIPSSVAQEARRRTSTIRIGLLIGAMISVAMIAAILQQGRSNFALVFAAAMSVAAFASANL